jgi:RNA polymerase sigma-54 factor
MRLQQQELEEAIEQELNDNPALERVDSIRDQPDATDVWLRMSGERQLPLGEDFESFAAAAAEPDDRGEWVDCIAAPVHLRDHLLAQLLATVSSEEAALARHIVDCVGDNGYLSMPIEEIALTAGADLSATLAVVRKLQQCEPAGVGAQDLQECLSIQLSELDDRLGLIAHAIVERHWNDLVHHRSTHIARKYKISEDEVAQAFELIAHLNPYPGEGFSPGAWGRTGAPAISPDVVFSRTDAGISIEVRGCDPNELLVNDWYRERYRAVRAGGRIDADERKHIAEFVGRAVNFIKAVHQRRRSLRKIAQCLLREQYGFITTGSYEFLAALTRVKVARSTGLHESTLSRATMNKHVQLANGEVVPFEVFFKPSLRVQKVMEDILRQENPNAPMADREIAAMLAERGIFIARRTVSKYREQLRLLSSHRRRTA